MPGSADVVRNRFQACRAARVGALLLPLLLLAACSSPPVYTTQRPAAPDGAPAPQQTQRMSAAQNSIARMVGLQDRLYRVAAPLLINNADLCKSQARNLLGFTAKNKYSYPGEFADAAQTALGYNEHLQVSGVLAGSGAARAGLRKGDTLVAADGKLLPRGANAETQAAAIFGPLVASRATLSMTIGRAGVDQKLNVPVTRACAFRVDLGNADNINSYADGQRVMLTRGMINYAQNDEAIAYVMAKDMAHNILGHATAQRSTATLGSVIDNLSDVEPDLSMLIGSAGIKAMPQELDAAADTLALYLLARAGYGIDNAARFWQRLATSYPASVLNGYTANHPGIAHRVAAINKGVAEIKAKQAGKKPLLP
ncbi:M48 family metallopeptidase [Janthinobacterium sp.]|uniref:M48 family metallopeptidase n=1 Tax=Janthinobacterium sp. TaxID=1871054 RepID=UPI00293D89BD|nr:M48 family metallopeptidase [Janthinobacterium sp.]